MKDRPRNPHDPSQAETQPLRPSKVRAMERGLRGLAERGVRAYSPSSLSIGGAAQPRIMLTRVRLDDER
jgi:hypothetical protein